MVRKHSVVIMSVAADADVENHDASSVQPAAAPGAGAVSNTGRTVNIFRACYVILKS